MWIHWGKLQDINPMGLSSFRLSLIATTVLNYKNFTAKSTLPRTFSLLLYNLPVKQTLITIQNLKYVLSYDDVYK